MQAAVANVERFLKGRDTSLPRNAPAPVKANYRPEIDISTILSPSDAAYYQSLIGILR